MQTSSSVSAAGGVTPAQARRALFSLVLGGLLIGASPVLVRISEVGGSATAFWRLTLALVPLGLLLGRGGKMAAATRQARPVRLRDHLALMLPGVLLAADLACWHYALHVTTIANATLLANMSPIFVSIGAWLLFRMPITRVFLTGLVLAVAGVCVLKGDEAEGAGNLFGDFMALGGAVFYAGYMLSLTHVRSRFPTLIIMIWASAAAALVSLPLALIFDPQLLPLTLAGWLILLALAWGGHAGGQAAIIYALAWLPPAFSALTLLIQPVVAALLAAAFLGESLGALQIVGGLTVVAGIVVARRG